MTFFKKQKSIRRLFSIILLAAMPAIYSELQAQTDTGVYLHREFLQQNRFFHTESLTQARMTFDEKSFQLHYDSISGMVPFEASGDYAVVNETTVRLNRSALKFDEWRAESYGKPEIPEVFTCNLEHDKVSYDYEYYLKCSITDKKSLRFGISGLRVKNRETRSYQLNCKEGLSSQARPNSELCKSESPAAVDIIIDRRELKVVRRCFLHKLPEENATRVGKNDLSFERMGSLSGLPNAFFSGDELYAMARYISAPKSEDHTGEIWYLVRYNTVMTNDGGFSNELWISAACVK